MVEADPASAVLTAEAERVDRISRASTAVVCVLDEEGGGGGSGVLIDPEGYGLTNYHVVAALFDDGRKGLGGLNDGRTYPLEVVGIDPTGDVAMFRLKGRPRFECVELGDSDAVRVGDWVMALGNPFLLAEDYTPSVSVGIVSGVHRYQPGTGAHQLVYTDCIQVDAAINPGNSGGPLLDAEGRLIGITGRAAFEERGRVNVGLGFAISINQIKRFLPGLRAGRLVEHGTLGATVRDVGHHRVVFDRVQKGSAAQKAGIRAGDRVHAFGGRPILSANQFLNVVGTFPAGWPAEISLEREGRRRDARLRLDAVPVKPPPWFDPGTTTPTAESSRPATRPGWQERPPGALARAIQVVSPAVVKLYGAGTALEPGYGSGVLVSPDGLVVTVASMLLEGQDIRAVTADGHVYWAKVAARDRQRQLALLRLQIPSEEASGDRAASAPASPTGLAHLSPGESASLRAGDRVLAFGNPFKVAEGEEPVSVLKGVFSGRIPLDARHRAQDFPYRGPVLLVDAITCNPGAAGGALTDLDGRWVGLTGRPVHSMLTRTRLNYALPIEEVAAFLEEAAQGRWSLESATPAPATQHKKGRHGIHLFSMAYRAGLPFVGRVEPGSPADRAGVRKDDLIISANGAPVATGRAFEQICRRLSAGEELILVVKRREKLVHIRLVLEEVPQ